MNKDLWMKLFLFSAVLGMAVSYQKVFLMHVVLVLFAVILMIPSLRERSNFHFNKQETPLQWFPLLMLVWYSIMTLVSNHLGHSLKYLFYVENGLAIILLIVYYTENLEYQKKVFQALAWIFVIEIIISLLEMYTKFRMPLSPYSPYLSFFGREYSPGFDVAVMKDTPTGFHWNPNDLAIAMTLIFPFFMLAKRWWVQIAGMIAIFLIVIADDSRSSLVALVVIMILSILLFQRKVLKVIIPVLVAGALLSSFYYDDIKDSQTFLRIKYTIESVQILLTGGETASHNAAYDSLGLRQQLTMDGIQSVIDSKGLGIGPGENMYIHKESTGMDYFALHNFWLELFVDGGVIFGLAFLVWHWYMAYRLWRITRRGKDPRLTYYAKGTFLSIVGFFFAAFSASSVIYFLPMWILYGFAIITIHNGKRLENI